MLTIDGSEGEGGGQVLRSALALSLVTGTPFRIDNIRAKREKTGLLRQHLTAVNAAAEIGSADVAGASLGSSRLDFKPGKAKAGNYAFAVGTAGSATLVLQTVLPALLTLPQPSTLVLEGGTHNPLAPPFDFLAKAFLPLLARMGPRVTAVLERPGFYPAGGGKFTVTVEPSEKLARLDIPERGELRPCRATALVASLPASIAHRELQVVFEKLEWPRASLRAVEVAGSTGPGNVLMLEIESEHVTEIVTGFGEKRRGAESVAQSAVDEARAYLAANVPVGAHLADQLLLPLALGAGGSFKTLELSLHATTNMVVIQRFIGGVKLRQTQIGRHAVLVEVEK